MPQPEAISPELQYVLLLFALFVVPRILQRYRLPSAVTSVALGALAGLGFGLFEKDATIQILSTLGIVSLFLFAGLEVDFRQLRRGTWVLIQHLVICVALLVAITLAVHAVLGLHLRLASLVALALVTPSTGFILDSLASLGVTDSERYWIKSKAIATELVALAVLFVTVQSTSALRFTVSILVISAMIALLPLAFRAFAETVVPHAPKSEFAFLLMIALLCAFVTRKLGVYYLVGAFVVGLTAQRFRERLPAVASEQMLHAVEVFASFFVPFYFFNAGLHLRRDDFGIGALALGVAFLVVVVPFRVALVAVHRRIGLGEPFRKGARIGASILPTLVFTLLIAEILRDRFGVSRSVFGGLTVYALVNTLIPGFALQVPLPAFEAPHAPQIAVREPSNGPDQGEG